MHLHGIGVDLVAVDRVRALLRHEGFARRWFGADELARCEAAPDPARALAAVLAAKEAAWKSLCTDWSGGVPWAGLCVLEEVPGAGPVTYSGSVQVLVAGHDVVRTRACWGGLGPVVWAVAVSLASPTEPGDSGQAREFAYLRSQFAAQ